MVKWVSDNLVLGAIVRMVCTAAVLLVVVAVVAIVISNVRVRFVVFRPAVLTAIIVGWSVDVGNVAHRQGFLGRRV